MKNAIMVALALPPAEQGRRLAALRTVLHTNTVHDWARSFLGELN